MRISKLILHGFKSFADKTEFDFKDGITVIVGPNGCGKSNVVDAVKWVLGEQRPTSLRGKEMQDVIFSGTDSRKGLGFAEVSLILDNGSQTLPLDYEEVSITRRLYRSGESEYLINGNNARLRDVRELLMDSGGGPGGLTVMEQGNIDRLLRADPQERRQVFEEAAGIAKYRARRRETQRKLERTNENLSRLRDILSEYETRQRSLKIQAGKARRFREMTEELKRKRLAGALSRYAALSRRRDDSLAELAEIERLEAEARRALETAVEASEGERKELDALREHVSAGEGEMAALVAESRAEAEKRLARGREAAELAERAAGAEQESLAANDRAETQRAERERARAGTEQARREHGERLEALAAANALLAEVEGRVALQREQGNALDLRRTEAYSAETEARNREIALQAEVRALRNRLARLEQRTESGGRELASLKQAHEERDLEVKRADEQLRGLEDRYTAAEQGIREGRRAAEERAQELTRRAGEVKALAARREVLARLVENGEGLGAGTRELLEAGREGRLQGIRGTLADLIGDAGPLAATLDQTLGELASAVVIDTTEQALAAIAWLKQGRRGRARVIPADRAGEAPLPEAFASIRTPAAPLLGALLAGTKVVGSVEEALAAGRGARVISLTGEEFEPRGTIVGGTGDAGAGLVLRNAELAAVAGKLEEAEDAQDEAEQLLAAANRDTVEWEETLEELRPRLKQTREAVRLAAQGLAAAEKAAAARAEEIDLETAELADIERTIAEAVAEAEAAHAELEKAEALRETFEGEAEELRQRLKRSGRDREEAAAKQTEAKVEAARWAEKAEAAEQRYEALGAAIEASEREGSARAEEARLCRERRAACLDEMEVIDRLAKEREAELERLTKEVERRRQAARELAEQIEEGGRRVRELRLAHEAKREELERHRLKENELRLRVETLLEQVRRDHGLDLAAFEGEEEPADPEALEAEIAELQAKLERLGNVNHTALEQLAEVEEKLEFMRREETDLVNAERQLRETITRIDEISTRRFRETFEQVHEAFKLVFRKLFGGGRAEISLEDPEDVLNSGIEIRVRPPGKELRNMALLSGGEKSLTTVALLFSIYRIKPPPFCLLDEVDAALDESNTVRMCEMLKEFAVNGQFLIITHARPTMTVADTLYGVTMPEAGVSRRVSVRFQDIEAGKVVGLN